MGKIAVFPAISMLMNKLKHLEQELFRASIMIHEDSEYWTSVAQQIEREINEIHQQLGHYYRYKSRKIHKHKNNGSKGILVHLGGIKSV